MKRLLLAWLFTWSLFSWQALPAAAALPAVSGDLQPDPALRFGSLPNGMHYILQQNATPAGQVSLRLRFDVGSINEAEDQRGLAHFLEHMAFRGSTLIPDGEVARILERLGLRLGADTNAFTSQTQTVYQFDLARNDDDSLRTGLTLLREICDHLRLDEASFNTERGVVTAEARVSNGTQRRTGEVLQAFLLQGQLAAARLPIGLPTVLETAPVERLRQFYRAWYRPDRATLVIVGDTDIGALERRITSTFGGWHNEAPAPPEPGRGQPMQRSVATRIFNEAGAQPALTFAWARPWAPRARTRADTTQELAQMLGVSILNRRLQTAAAAADRKFIQGGAGELRVARSADFTLMSLSYEPGQWQGALQGGETLRRQLAEQGAQQAELDRELLALRTVLQSRAAGASTRRSPAIATELIGNLDDDGLNTSADQDLQLFDELRPQLTLAAINAALRESFAGSGPLLFLSTPQAIAGDETALVGALRAADTTKLAETAAAKSLTWPYTKFGRGGAVVAQQHVADLDFSSLRFANGVKLNVKSTHFSADQIMVNVHVGDGLLGMPRDRPGLLWAAAAVPLGGLGKLSYEELQRVLTGKVWRIGFGVGDGSYNFVGQTRQEDLLTQLQVLAAYVTDGGFRPEGFEQFRESFLPQLATVRVNPSQVLGTQLANLIHDGDPRWTFPTAAQVQAASARQLRDWLQPALAHGDIEIAIVGDVSVEAAKAAVADTFGALQGQRQRPRIAVAGEVRFPSGSATPISLAHSGAPDQGIAVMAWPGTDALSDLKLSAQRQLLLGILQGRLRERLRERDGISYNVSMQNQSSTVFPGFGAFIAGADLPPAKAPLLFEAMTKVAADLRAQPPTADELERARNPVIASLKQAQQANQYWLANLGQVQREPRLAEAVRQSLPNLQAVTAADLQAFAARFLVLEKAVRIVVQPESAPK